MKPDVQAYLDRIGYGGSTAPNAETLAALQYAHLHAVPYENLDLIRGIPLSLAIDRLYDKIVLRRRGGYCFEVNALFGWLLAELGFEVTNLFARFWRGEPNPPPMLRHHVLKVKADGAYYLCDVGVGGIIPRYPVVMAEHLEQPQGHENYRLVRDDSFGWFLQEWKDEDWKPIYSFTEQPALPVDYAVASFWCEHSPESFFHRRAMLSLRTEGGRNTVDGDEFRIFSPQGVHVFVPETEEARREALERYFGIILPEQAVNSNHA